MRGVGDGGGSSRCCRGVRGAAGGGNSATWGWGWGPTIVLFFELDLRLPRSCERSTKRGGVSEATWLVFLGGAGLVEDGRDSWHRQQLSPLLGRGRLRVEPRGGGDVTHVAIVSGSKTGTYRRWYLRTTYLAVFTRGVVCSRFCI